MSLGSLYDGGAYEPEKPLWDSTPRNEQEPDDSVLVSESTAGFVNAFFSARVARRVPNSEFKGAYRVKRWRLLLANVHAWQQWYWGKSPSLDDETGVDWRAAAAAFSTDPKLRDAFLVVLVLAPPRVSGRRVAASACASSIFLRHHFPHASFVP